MSNEYKEWEKERQEEAWEDIYNIAKLYEEWRNNGSSASDIYNVFEKTLNILDNNKWI